MERDYVIITDSSNDLPAGYAEEQGVCMEKALKDAFFNAVGDSYDRDLSGKL